jgi:hypothetical protein
VNFEVAEKLHAVAAHTVGTLGGGGAEALVCHQVQQLENGLASVQELEKLLAQTYQALPARATP